MFDRNVDLETGFWSLVRDGVLIGAFLGGVAVGIIWFLVG